MSNFYVNSRKLVSSANCFTLNFKGCVKCRNKVYLLEKITIHMPNELPRSKLRGIEVVKTQ